MEQDVQVKKLKFIESEIIDIDGERIVKYGSKSYRIKLFKGRNSYREYFDAETRAKAEYYYEDDLRQLHYTF